MSYKEAKRRLQDHFRIHNDGRPTPYLDEAEQLVYKALDVVQEMADRGVQPEDIMNYLAFEDECVKKGFDFKSLLEAREKMTPKKPYYLQYGTNPKIGNWHCNIGHIILNKCDYCPDCGQKLDWSEAE